MTTAEYNKTIEDCKRNFENHEIMIVVDGPDVKQFAFMNTKSGMYSFQITTSNNLIVLNGDIGPLVVEPGYGRCGFQFLLDHVVRDRVYFMSKCPNQDHLSEYSPKKALALIKEWTKEGIVPKTATNKKALDDADLDNLSEISWESYWGKVAYYKFCSKHNVDDPEDPSVLKFHTLNQIAGLQCFVKKYQDMIARNKVESETKTEDVPHICSANGTKPVHCHQLASKSNGFGHVHEPRNQKVKIVNHPRVSYGTCRIEDDEPCSHVLEERFKRHKRPVSKRKAG